MVLLISCNFPSPPVNSSTLDIYTWFGNTISLHTCDCPNHYDYYKNYDYYRNLSIHLKAVATRPLGQKVNDPPNIFPNRILNK